VASALITMEAFLARMASPDADGEDLRRYVMLDVARSDAFRPRVVLNPATLVHDPEAAWLGGGLSELSRQLRQQRYRERIAAGWQGRRLVSEGDSWFQYPVLLRDVIDQLEADNAVFCLAGTGDTLDNMQRASALTSAIVEHRPHAVLLSAGGNDLLGRFRLYNLIRPFEPGLPPKAYPLPAYEAVLAQEIGVKYRRLLGAIRAVAPGTPVLLHGYAYALPREMIWLGLPMRARGIIDPALQQAIVRVLLDRFHALLAALAADPELPHVTLVDCRRAVGRQWADEMHPNNNGFAAVAALFRAALPAV
jgi:hypothetical protein